MARNERTRAALRGAAARLLRDKAVPAHDLTIDRLARSAGVSRATVYRAPDILDDFRTAVRARTKSDLRDSQERCDFDSREHKRLRQNFAKEKRELKRTIKVLANQVQLLTLENERLLKQLGTHSKVTALRPRGRR